MKTRSLCLLVLVVSWVTCRADETFVSGTFDAIGNPGVALYLGDQRNAETIAFGDGFVVLWDDKTDSDEQLYLRLMDVKGEWQSPRIELSLAGGEQKRPAAVEVGGRVFILWEDDRNGLGTRDLYGTFLSSDGVIEDRRGFLFLDTLTDKSDVEMDAIGEVVVAVWEERVGFASPEIYAVRIGPDGELLDAQPSFIAAGKEPAIVAGDGQFAIVYQDPSDNLEMQRVSASPDGEFLIDGPVEIHTDPETGNGAIEPVVAWDGNRYGVAWIGRTFSDDSNLLFLRVGPDGVVIDPVPVRLGPIKGDAEVDMVADARGFVVVARLGLRSCGLRTLVEDAAMNLVVSPPRTLSQPRNIVQDPSVAFAKDGTLLIAWEDELWERNKSDGENLFTVVGDAFGELSLPRVMLSWPMGIRPTSRGVATVRDGDGYGVFWRTWQTQFNSGTIYYSKIGEGTGWQAVTEVIGGNDGPNGIWAMQIDGQTRAYWRAPFGAMQTISRQEIELAQAGRRVALSRGTEIEVGAAIDFTGMTPGPIPSLGTSSMLAWPDGVELVVGDGNNRTMSQFWIPWGSAEAPVVTALAVAGTKPKLFREGNRTFMLAATVESALPSAVRSSWEHQDLITATDPEFLDFAAVTGHPATARPVLDAQGRVLFVSHHGKAVFSSALTKPRITRFWLELDGRVGVELQGLPYGEFRLDSSIDLKDWGVDHVSVPLDHSGFGSIVLDRSGADEQRFWRGVYRP